MPERSEQIELPRPGATRWGARQKSAVVLGIHEGLITREQAYEMYDLSPEELASWEEAFEAGGHTALIGKTHFPRTGRAD